MKLINTDTFSQKDHDFMALAYKLAQKAKFKGEIPIGALIVDEAGTVLAKAINVRETKNTALGHAELVAIHRACQKKKSWRLTDCTLYVTLEPCFMCAGALSQSRIKRVVYATPDPKGGALGSLADLSTDQRLNHRFTTEQGLMLTECSHILKEFFKDKRAQKKSLNRST